MRVVPFLVIGAACAGFIGCTAFGKKPANQPTSPPRSDIRSVPAQATQAPAPAASPVATASMSGILAGQVIDDTNSHPPAIYVQVLEPGVRGAPVEMPTDPQGYFTIQGLQVGHSYQLIARARLADRVLAGSVMAMPPNPRVLIRLIPDISMPAAPAYAQGTPYGQPDPRVMMQPPPTYPAPNASATAPPRRPAELGAPIGIPPQGAPYPGLAPQGFNDPSRPRVEVRPEDIAQNGRLARNDLPADIPGPINAAIGGQILSPPPPPADLLGGPVRVPSCNLTGQTLYNFALNDLDGQPWEFRQRHGRVVLLDFWGTWCMYCQQAIPHLKDMQLRYGPYGLEVIGIAYEHGPVSEQVQKVSRVRNRLGINYKLLLGSDQNTCPVRTQFQVRSWPTFVLLDDQGRIIWRGEGVDAQSMRTLEVIIRQRLGLR